MTAKSYLETCIPSDKHDMAAVGRARELGFPGLNPIIDDLLIWLQDANWPLAGPVSRVLCDAGPEIAPAIREVFASDDSIWKYWILDLLVDHLSGQTWDAVRMDVEKLSKSTNQDDVIDEVPARAGACLVFRQSI